MNGPAVAASPRSGVREESVQRAKAVFNTIKGWLVSEGSGVSQDRMVEFLDTQWNPPLTAAEKRWILGSWPGRVPEEGGNGRFYADLDAGGSGSPAVPLAGGLAAAPRGAGDGGRGVSSSPMPTGRPAGTSYLPAAEAGMASPAFPNNDTSAIPNNYDNELSLNGIHTPPMAQRNAPRPRAAPGWDPADLPPPPDSTPPVHRGQVGDSGGISSVAGDVSAQLLTRARSMGAQSAGVGEAWSIMAQDGGSPAPASTPQPPPVPPQQPERNGMGAQEAARMAVLEAEVARLREQNEALAGERDAAFKESRELASEVRALKDRADAAAFAEKAGHGLAVEGEGGKAGEEWRVAVRIDEARNLPTSISSWHSGNEWQHTSSGLQAYVSVGLSGKGGGEEHSVVCTQRVRYCENPRWGQALTLHVNLAKHDVFTLKLVLVVDGEERVAGFLRIATADLIARGTSEGWHNLMDANEDPMRNHQGDNSCVSLKVDVAEREVDRLRMLLTQATAELGHVRSNIGHDIREQMRTLRSQNRLLHATVGDLEDELLLAKDALLLAGKKGEERLVAQVQLLHRELRMAWMQQEAQQTSMNAQELDERLRQEMARLTKQDSDLKEAIGGAVVKGGGGMIVAAQGSTFGGGRGFGTPTIQAQAPTVLAGPPSVEGGTSLLSVGAGGEGSVNGTSFTAGRGGAVAGGVGTMLKICVVEAKGLALDDKIRCNPHAAIVMGKVKKSTRVEANTTRPHWGDEKFSFEIPKGQEEGPSRYVTITVFNRGAYSKDECIGMVGLSLKRVRDSPSGTLDEWFPLSLSKGDKREAAHPSIRVQAKIIDPPSDANITLSLY